MSAFLGETEFPDSVQKLEFGVIIVGSANGHQEAAGSVHGLRILLPSLILGSLRLISFWVRKWLQLCRIGLGGTMKDCDQILRIFHFQRLSLWSPLSGAEKSGEWGIYASPKQSLKLPSWLSHTHPSLFNPQGKWDDGPTGLLAIVN